MLTMLTILGLYRGLRTGLAYNPHIRQPCLIRTLIGDDQITVEIAARCGSRCSEACAYAAPAPFDPALHRLVLIIQTQPANSLPHRRWMNDRFAQLIQRILAPELRNTIEGRDRERSKASMSPRRVPTCRVIGVEMVTQFGVEMVMR